MVVNRWYGGIPAGDVAWSTFSLVAPADKHTYVYDALITNDYDTAVTYYEVWGTVYGETIEKMILRVPTAEWGTAALITQAIALLKPGSVFFIKYTSANSGAVHSMQLAAARLPPADIRTREEVIKEIAPGNQAYILGTTDHADVTEHIAENDSQLTNAIIQPYFEAAKYGLKADELYISSTHADDTLAGDGAQKVTITYFDSTFTEQTSPEISLSGITPVELIASGIITDLLLISSMNVTQVGANRVNTGEIYLHDAAV